MKIKLPILIAFVFLLFFGAQELYSNRAGAPVARSGGAGEANCATSTCHQGTANSGTGLLTITSDAPGNIYTPNQTYTITVTLTLTGKVRFGFEVLSAHQSSSNSSKGTVVITDVANTKQLTSGQKRYVTHTTAGTAGTSDTHTWTFDWTAPASGAGDLTFYVAGNITDNSNSRFNDQIYTSSITLTELPTSIQNHIEQSWMGLANAGTANTELILKNFPLQGANVVVRDVNGNIVSDETVSVTGEEAHFHIPTETLAPGIYFLVAGAGNIVRTQKFVVY